MKPPPPLNYIRSFECSARHLSFTAAAEELGYTQAAISNHVRALEQYIGRRLFTRYPRSLKLTEMGEAFLPTLRQALDQIDHATEAIVAKARKRSVVVSCPMSLAENWLAGTMAEFRNRHSEIEVVLQGTVWEDPSDQLADITISVKRFDDRPAASTLLWDDQLVLVCSPDFLGGSQELERLQEITKREKIYVLGRQEYWQCFADLLKIEIPENERGLTTNASNIALELAATGAGIVATQLSLARTYLQRGLLVEPFSERVPSPWAYYLTDNQHAKGNVVRTVREWILERATQDFGRPSTD